MARKSVQPPEVHALAATLRKRRDELGLSQTEVATAAGLNRSYVNEIEAGARNPTWTALRALARGYQSDLVDIVASAELAADAVQSEISGPSG